jgi:hypothetical protein
MADIDDKYYYRFKSVALELDYLAKEVKEAPNGVPTLVQSETKRDEIRVLLAKSRAAIEAIQSKMGEKFTPEFRDV